MFNKKEKELLLGLFHLYAPSNGEKPVLDFIKNVLGTNNIPFKEDNNGNIYCLNHPDQPLLSAHTDCVGTAEAGAYVKFINIYEYGDEEIMKGLGNIGGDDKCGVFLILLYLLSKRPVNAVFSICEEIGGAAGITTLLETIKSNAVFKSCPYCLVLDRKHSGDIICSRNDYGSKEFEDALAEIGKDFGYSPAVGSCSDMNKIKAYMNGCNLSVGYHNPHSNTEFVSLNELYNAYQYVQALIEKMPRNIPLMERKESTYYYPNSSSYYNKYFKDRDEYYKDWY